MHESLETLLDLADIPGWTAKCLDVRTLSIFARASKRCAQLTVEVLAHLDWWIYVIGETQGDIGNPVARYRVSSDTWDVLPALPYPCCSSRSSMVVLEGQIYIFVAISNSDDAEVLLRCDPHRREWENLGVLPLLQIHHGELQAAVLDGFIYLVGYESRGQGCYHGPKIARFGNCGASYKWELLPPLNTRRSDFKLVAAAGAIYALGGWHDCDAFERYDPTTQQWESLEPLRNDGLKEAINAKYSDCITSLGTHIFVCEVGEECTVGMTHWYLSCSCWCYDCGAKTWTRGPPMPTIRRIAQLVSMNGIAYVIGGATKDIDADEESSFVVEGFIPCKFLRGRGRWKRLAETNYEAHQLAVALGNGKQLFGVGACNDDHEYILMECFMPDEGEGCWEALSPLPNMSPEGPTAAVAVPAM